MIYNKSTTIFTRFPNSRPDMIIINSLVFSFKSDKIFADLMRDYNSMLSESHSIVYDDLTYEGFASQDRGMFIGFCKINNLYILQLYGDADTCYKLWCFLTNFDDKVQLDFGNGLNIISYEILYSCPCPKKLIIENKQMFNTMVQEAINSQIKEYPTFKNDSGNLVIGSDISERVEIGQELRSDLTPGCIWIIYKAEGQSCKKLINLANNTPNSLRELRQLLAGIVLKMLINVNITPLLGYIVSRLLRFVLKEFIDEQPNKKPEPEKLRAETKKVKECLDTVWKALNKTEKELNTPEKKAQFEEVVEEIAEFLDKMVQPRLIRFYEARETVRFFAYVLGFCPSFVNEQESIVVEADDIFLDENEGGIL